jgi:hypothetical protein
VELTVVGCGEMESGTTTGAAAFDALAEIGEAACCEEGRALATLGPPEQPESAAAAARRAVEDKALRMNILKAPREVSFPLFYAIANDNTSAPAAVGGKITKSETITLNETNCVTGRSDSYTSSSTRSGRSVSVVTRYAVKRATRQ